MSLSLKIFADFDGTITVNDVGDALFERFGGVGCREIIQLYQEGQISAAECFRRESAACGIVDVAAMNAFLDHQPIDPTFREFVRFCAAEQIALTIFSDGMDYYIWHILSREGLGHLPLFSNRLNLLPCSDALHVRFDPEFPHESDSCDRCASCKRAVMVSNTSDDDVVIMIGEGFSDRCPAPYADIIFAKDNLLTWCREQELLHYEYRSFGDIARRLHEMLSVHRTQPGKSRLHKRRQAELARKALFVAE